jgi:OPA family glycerol-3-phosphate transporter-like MFS transporter
VGVGDPKHIRRWQAATLILLFVGYSGYYLCRSNLSVAKPLMVNDLMAQGVDKLDAQKQIGDMVGRLFTWGTLAYALGKFGFGAVGDLLGGRRNFLGGMGGAVLFTALFALGGGLPIFLFAWVANRLVQSAGWPGMVKIAGRWFDYRSHGTALGFLSLSYLFGDAAARAFMARMIRLGLGWHGLFFVNAVVLFVILVVCYLFLKESPGAIGAVEGSASPTNVYGTGETLNLLGLLRPLLTSPAFWCVCLLSLALTFLRETFGNWNPTYFKEAAGFSDADAADLSAAFSFLGGCSVIAAGLLSDRLGFFGRGIVLFLGLLLSALLLALLSQVSASEHPYRAAALVLVTAFTLIGPYSYLAGAVALDFGGKKGGATASGFIDGVGYLGGMAAGTAVVELVQARGWPLAWAALAAVAMASCLVAAIYWRGQARLLPVRPDPEGQA